MEVNLFVETDYKELCEWYHGWKKNPPKLEFLSCLGVIVPGIAAGFLTTSNVNVGIIDSFITNRKAGKKDRDQALDLITEKIIYLAKGVGCKALKFNTKYDTIKLRAKKFGFNDVGNYTVFMKEI